jgi:hypothetical protein
MKNNIFMSLMLLLITGVTQSQWQPDFQLTNNTAHSYTSYNNAWCIAPSGSDVHVVWYDDRDGNYEIYYKRSSDAGVSWGTDTRLTNNTSASGYPSVAVSGSAVHVVWRDERDGNYEIYYKRSITAGLVWTSDIRLTNNASWSSYPSITINASVLHVVWQDNRDGNYEIYYKRSNDGGVNWGSDTRLTFNANDSRFPSSAVNISAVHTVWHDNRDGNWEIYYKRSNDGGINWGADTRLTNNTAESYYPSVAVSGLVVHVVWHDTRDGNEEIYYKRSTDGGVNWGSDQRLTNNTYGSGNPSISVSGSLVHVVWYDYRDGNYEIYYKRSTDGGVNWGSDTRLTNNSAESLYPSAAVYGTNVYVVWYDSRTGNYEIYYKRDPTGNPIGIKNIGLELPKKFSLLQNYPNPFNPKTTFTFSIPKREKVQLIVYDVLGHEIVVLVNNIMNSGNYLVDFDATNLSSGIYLYKLVSGNFVDVKKMVLVR